MHINFFAADMNRGWNVMGVKYTPTVKSHYYEGVINTHSNTKPTAKPAAPLLSG